MKARQILADAVFEPDAVRVMFRAFDEAWEQIAPSVSSRADAIEAARLKLANIILSLARNGSNDPEQIKNAALQLWSANPSKRAG